MQIVRHGKVSWLHDLLVIRGKTFAIVQQLGTPYNKKEKIRWKTFAIGGKSTKTAKVFHRKRFALYDICMPSIRLRLTMLLVKWRNFKFCGSMGS